MIFRRCDFGLARAQIASHTAGWLPYVWFLLCFLGCCACHAGRPLATLQLTLGVVERDLSAQPRVWKAAEVGASFGLGDGIQTRSGSSALLQLDDGDQLSMEPDTLLRFASTPPVDHSLDIALELGSITVQAAQSGLTIQTRSGPARIAAGSRVSLSASPGGLRFKVQVGRAFFGASGPISAGEGLLIDPKGTLTRFGAGEPASAVVASQTLPDAASAQLAAGLPEQVAAHVTGRHASVRTEAGWAALPEGATHLSAGTELNLERNTSVLLEQRDQRAVLQKSGRYVVAPRPGVLVAAASGALSAGGSGTVRIEVPGGTIEIVPQGQASILLSDQLVRIDVQAREASLHTRAGVQRIGAGERAALHADGRTSIEGRSLDYADLQLDAGESLIIHDPAPPTAVRFAFGAACPESGALQLLRDGKARAYAVGRAAVALPITPGDYRYELRCAADKPVAATGSLAVQRDGGTRRMAARQPVATLQADGRDYTILYQNRLPDITLVWGDAPSGQALSLIHEFESKSDSIALAEPTHVFASGSLAEGKHVLHFVGGGKISRRTTANVVFDNAAPKASISTPVSVAVAPGDELTITGTALPGWDVSIEGQPAKRDAQGRFSLPVTWPRERHALAIRLSHPERGVHVYLRRRKP
ncbi:MAG: hypothetical protein ABI895_23380 [Deltaproteobacteria bacterium]